MSTTATSDNAPFTLSGIHTTNDAEFDHMRTVNRSRRIELASRRGTTLRDVEDVLAAMQTSAFDRRVARQRLAESRGRMGW